MFIRKHFLISGLMMAALVPFPVLAQNAGAGNAATANSAGASAGANPGTAAINNNNNAGTNHGSSANEAAVGQIQIVPVQNLINRPLVDRQGHDAGKINRVVINTANGAVDFVIVAGNGDFNLNGNVVALPWEAIATPIAAHGFLGLAPHWFAIPVQALAGTPFRGGYRLTTSARLLANEPTIPVQTKLPTEVPAMQLAQLYQHFGLRPYWDEGSGQNGQGHG